MSSHTERPRVLIVDNEPDVCETVVDVLSDYQVDTAMSFEEAVAKLSSREYDVALFDIMGVRGHELLDRFGSQVPCIMLTAHALTRAAFERSVRGRARLFLPKEEIGNLEVHVERVLETQEPLWSWLLRTLDFRRWFGPSWLGEAIAQELLLAELETGGDGERLPAELATPGPVETLRA
jgi:CheY-like chemotaxis protein